MPTRRVPEAEAQHEHRIRHGMHTRLGPGPGRDFPERGALQERCFPQPGRPHLPQSPGEPDQGPAVPSEAPCSCFVPQAGRLKPLDSLLDARQTLPGKPVFGEVTFSSLQEYNRWKSSDRICRQLIYHLTPHSKWHRQGGPRRKSQASLKNNLQKKLSQDAINLSGISLSTRDVHRLAYYLQSNGAHLQTVDLSFTDLTDEAMRLLLPFLWSLPNLTHLSLNGNRLTRATVRELTDAVKDMSRFPVLAWVDLGNNVDIASMPQPLLVGLRKRLSLRNSLPTIYESLDYDSESSSRLEEEEEEEEGRGEREGVLLAAGAASLDTTRRQQQPLAR